MRVAATCSTIGVFPSDRRHARGRRSETLAGGGYWVAYWGLSFRQASRARLDKLAERHEVKPAGRRWKIAVCGPHRSPQVELGDDFEITWEPAGADFARRLAD